MPISYKEAVAYSHNYATAKPDIGETEKEHILGLCNILERVGKEQEALAAHQAGMERELQASQAVLHSLASDGQVTPDHARTARDVLDRTSLASLQRHDAGVCARELKDVYGDLPGDLMTQDLADWLLARRDRYMKQAKGKAQ